MPSPFGGWAEGVIMTKTEECIECEGEGRTPGGETECDWCDGLGRVDIDDDTPIAEPPPSFTVEVIWTDGDVGLTLFENVTGYGPLPDWDGMYHIQVGDDTHYINYREVLTIKVCRNKEKES